MKIQALLFATAFASGALLPGLALANKFGPVSRDLRMITDHVIPVQGGGGGGGGGTRPAPGVEIDIAPRVGPGSGTGRGDFQCRTVVVPGSGRGPEEVCEAVRHCRTVVVPGSGRGPQEVCD